ASAPADDPTPLEPVAPTPPATPVGPIELGHVRDAWPEVLGQLEVASRSSWLTVSTATVVAFDADVLTLAFRTSADLTAVKTRTRRGPERRPAPGDRGGPRDPREVSRAPRRRRWSGRFAAPARRRPVVRTGKRPGPRAAGIRPSDRVR
ncbi:hypothetical protein HR12_36670, partial [Microbacterium sp. SUBG005]